MSHLRWDWRLTPATSAPGLGAHPCHICNGTGLLFGVGIALRLPSQQCRLIRLHRARTMLADRLGHRREVHDRPCARVPHPVVLECEARLQSAQLGAAERNALCATASACAGRAAQRALRTPGPSAVLVRNMWQRCAPSRCRCGNMRGVTRAAGVRRTMAVALHGTGSSRRAKARCRRDGGCGGGGWRARPTVPYVACRMMLRVTCCTLYDVARDALHVARRIVVRRIVACACRPAGRRDPPELVAVIRRDFQLAVLLTRPARRDRLQRIAPPAAHARLSA